jgi:hypothetical protein
MKPPQRALLALSLPLALTLTLVAASALADDDCDVPIEQWQPRAAVLQKAAQQGWKVQRLKIDDGCYEIRGRDEQGRRFKAKLDPHTLETVKMKRRDRDRDRDSDKERDRERSRERVHGPVDAASAADGGSAPSSILEPGTRPRATIE